VTPQRTSDRTFGLTFAVVFGTFALVFWLLSGSVLHWALGAAGALAVLALLAPGVLLPLNRAWSSLALRIGWLSNRVLLGVFFYGVVTPMGVGARVLRRQFMVRRPEPSAETYWSAVGRQATDETYPDMF
jgi:hypothetical protein